MLSASFGALICLSLARIVSAGQVPVVNGVVGGVPTATVQDIVPAATTTGILGTPTPGKLRYVENSGICGTPWSSVSFLQP